MKIKNKIGPSTDPWGTPLKTSNSSDFELLITTLCFRFSRKALIQFRICPFIPCFLALTVNGCVRLSQKLYESQDKLHLHNLHPPKCSSNLPMWSGGLLGMTYLL